LEDVEGGRGEGEGGRGKERLKGTTFVDVQGREV
jgi:hypothetical protein